MRRFLSCKLFTSIKTLKGELAASAIPNYPRVERNTLQRRQLDCLRRGRHIFALLSPSP